MIAARSASVIVRGTTSGGSSGGGAMRARPSSAATRSQRVERRRVGRAGTREGRGERPPTPRAGTARRGRSRVSCSRAPGVAVRAVQQQPRPQLRLGVRLVLRQHAGRQLLAARQDRPALDEDQLAGDGDERADVADPVVLERRERVEVGLGEVAERDGQDVELARLDEREQQAQRPGERRRRHVGRRSRRAGGPRRRRSTSAGAGGRPVEAPSHQFASSARRSSSPNSASRGASWSRISATVRGEQPAAAARSAERRGVGLEPPQRRAPARHDPRDAPDPRGRSAAPASTRRAARRPCRPCRASWSSPATRTSRSATPSAAERRDDVEAVASVGDVHRVEERELRCGQPGRQLVALRGRDARAERASGTGGPC